MSACCKTPDNDASTTQPVPLYDLIILFLFCSTAFQLFLIRLCIWFLPTRGQDNSVTCCQKYSPDTPLPNKVHMLDAFDQWWSDCILRQPADKEQHQFLTCFWSPDRCKSNFYWLLLPIVKNSCLPLFDYLTTRSVILLVCHSGLIWLCLLIIGTLSNEIIEKKNQKVIHKQKHWAKKGKHQ